MRKRIVLVFMLVALLVFAVACDNSSNDNEPTATPTQQATEEPTAEPTKEPTPEPTDTPAPTEEPDVGTNVALNKPVEVSSSTKDPGNWDPAFVNDGNITEGTLGWTSQVGVYLENDDHNEFVIIDLEKEYNITAVYLWPRQDAGNEGIYFPVNYEILVSSDKEEWTSVYKKEGDYGAEEWNTDVRGIVFEEAVKGRYVKVHGTELTATNAQHAHLDGPLMQLGEIEVYSKDE